MEKLYLLDAYALIYRAYYALIRTPRINSKGMNTSAVFGFVNTLEELLKKENPDVIVLTEHWHNMCDPVIPFEEKFVTYDHMVVTRMADKAKEHGIICNVFWSDNAEEAEKFIEMKPDRPQIFYIWGHSYEFDAKKTEEAKIEYTDSDLQATLPLVKTQLKALIARDLWSISEYFELINPMNEIYKQGLRALKDEKIFENIQTQ